jgi:hypothetical protein
MSVLGFFQSTQCYNFNTKLEGTFVPEIALVTLTKLLMTNLALQTIISYHTLATIATTITRIPPVVEKREGREAPEAAQSVTREAKHHIDVESFSPLRGA